MRTDWGLFEQFTLGIEEEFQIVDPNTRGFRHVAEGLFLSNSIFMTLRIDLIR